MRISHNDISCLKRTAKLLSRISHKSLSQCQQAVAKGTGFRDWHEMQRYVSKKNSSVTFQSVSLDDQASAILAIAEQLRDHFGLVQYAAAEGRLFDKRNPNLDNQLTVRGLALRKSSIPYLGKRKRGEIGKINSAGFRTFPVILKKHGRPTMVLGNKSPDTACADFEYVSPRNEQPLHIPSRLYLAYGYWKEADGATVLFSRDYFPMWRLRDEKVPEPLNPMQHIWKVSEGWFWDDTNTPWENKRRHREEMDRLAKSRVRALPLLTDVLPLLVNRDDVNSIKKAVELCFVETLGKSAA